ncbi:hypothetical protein LPJGGPFB_04805 [Ensifer adhaerens]|nr:hypothetical protein [Ensifer adhaerens]
MNYEKIGRALVMVRLPRYRLQLAEFRSAELCDLLENYGLALVRRDELRSQNGSDDMVVEYEELCESLEDYAIRLISRATPRLVL